MPLVARENGSPLSYPKGLARRALADALGWDESTVRKYEEGVRPPDSQKLAQLCAVLGDRNEVSAIHE